MTIFVSTRLAEAFSVKDTERCACGGFKCVVHCPECGSTQCYSRKRDNISVTLPDSPKPVISRGFRCKLCGAPYHEYMCVTSCHAKTRWRQQSDAEKRVKEVIDHAPPDTVNEILKAGKQYLQRKRGASIIDEVSESIVEPIEERSPLDIADEERAKLKREKEIK